MLTSINPTFANPVALILAIILAIALTTPTPAQVVRPAAVHDTALLSSNPAHLAANAADEAAPLNRRAIIISGIIQRPDGTPIENAAIISSAGGKAISNPDGSFTLEVDVPESAESLDVTAVATIDSVNYTAIRLVELSPGDRRRDISAMPLSANGDGKPEWFPTFGGEGGVNNLIRALTVFDDGAGPALYAGGRFTTAWGIGHPARPADTSRLTGDGASVSVDRPLRERELPIAWNWSPISALFGTAQSEPMITFAWQGALQHDQVTVRARLSTEGTARLVYSTDPNMSNPGFTSEVQSAGDNIATIELSALVP